MVYKKVTLKSTEEGKDILLFNLGESYQIDLNSSDQSYLRDVFSKILSLLIEDYQLRFELDVEANYNKRLFIDIAEEYIIELNKELDIIVNEMPNIFLESKKNDNISNIKSI